MTKSVISVEHLSKQYDLGVIGTGTLSRDLNRWWARVRHQPDPYTRIGQQDAFARIGESILALDDVSFTVNQGEALGIIGKNGAGKSTLLKILSRVTAPTSGVVKVKGRIGSLLEVGTGVHPELTGRENVYLNGAILGMKKAEVTRKFDEIVDFSGVEKFIDTPVKRYSSGMYVRLAFAVAAHLDPEILIVDEVLAVGDAEFQKKCLGKMGNVAGEGRTVLFVSHNMGAINDLCNRTILISNGKIASMGDTKLIVANYLGRIASSNINGFEKSVRRISNDSLKITSVKIGKSQNEITDQIPFSSELFIESTLFCTKKTVEASMFILIKNSAGDYILSPFQLDEGETFNIDEGQQVRIACTLPFIGIAPGMYFVDLGIFDQSKHLIEWIENASAFTVFEDKIIKKRLGQIYIRGKWKISEAQ